ncbi:MAG: hypothetical protein GYB66_11015 [Chloroflexi bacterium]|nr:hypothetical protein [Chloroflexota bacterium]
MSKVVSFRLDEETPEEQQALAILETWQRKGYSTREIMTWALMALEGTQFAEPSKQTDDAKETISELRVVLSQAQDFLEALRDMKAMPDEVQVSGNPKPILTDQFMASVRKAVRPGLTLPDEQTEPDNEES